MAKRQNRSHPSPPIARARWERRALDEAHVPGQYHRNIRPVLWSTLDKSRNIFPGPAAHQLPRLTNTLVPLPEDEDLAQRLNQQWTSNSTPKGLLQSR